jgi:hypothetical protein
MWFVTHNGVKTSLESNQQHHEDRGMSTTPVHNPAEWQCSEWPVDGEEAVARAEIAEGHCMS